MTERRPFPWVHPRFPTPVSGTDGIRGRVGTLITPALACSGATGAGHVASPAKGPVPVGMDPRTASPMLLRRRTAGLTLRAVKWWEPRLCPNPRRFPAAIRRLERPEVDGFRQPHPPKTTASSCSAPPRQTHREVQHAHRSRFLRGDLGHRPRTDRGKHGAYPLPARPNQRTDLLADLQHALLRAWRECRLQAAKIVLDLCWGIATPVALSVPAWRRLKVLPCEPDGRRINVGCGSTPWSHYARLCWRSGAQMGFAFDGDADRMLARDGRGRVVDGDQILFLWGGPCRKPPRLPTTAGGHGDVQPVASSGLAAAWRPTRSHRVGDHSPRPPWRPAVRPWAVNNPATSFAAARHEAAMALLTALQVASLIHGRGGSWLSG